MNEREYKAREAFKSGYNCSMSIIVAFKDLLDMDEKQVLRLASSFGGGMGRMREVCGSISGIFMIAGFLYGYEDPKDYEGKKELYTIIQDLAARFKDETGTIICRELLGLEGDGKDNSPIPSQRTESYYKKRPCEEKIGLAARILDEYIQEHPPVNK